MLTKLLIIFLKNFFLSFLPAVVTNFSVGNNLLEYFVSFQTKLEVSNGHSRRFYSIYCHQIHCFPIQGQADGDTYRFLQQLDAYYYQHHSTFLQVIYILQALTRARVVATLRKYDMPEVYQMTILYKVVHRLPFDAKE